MRFRATVYLLKIRQVLLIIHKPCRNNYSDFFHSSFMSQDRAAIPVGRLSSWYTQCGTAYFRLAPVSELYEANYLELCGHRLYDRYPRNSPRVVICVDSQGQGKTQRFASVLQRRAFTLNWTNWSTWHVYS